MDSSSIKFLGNFEFRESKHTRLTAHVAFEHANGKSMSNVAKEFGLPQHHVLRFYRSICRHVYREIRRHICRCDEFSEFQRTILLSATDEVLHDSTFRHPTGIKLIEKYYLFVCEQEKKNPEKNWLDEIESPPDSKDEINRKKINQLLIRLKTRHDNLIKNAESEYKYLTKLVQDIIEPKKKEASKPRYDMMESHNMAAKEEIADES
jgi:hypothetical protein